MKALIPIIAIAIASLTIGCEKCKDCYLVEEPPAGPSARTFIGEKCDQEIDALEKHDLVCLGECYYECE